MWHGSDVTCSQARVPESRRGRLKPDWPKGRVGSNPTPGTQMTIPPPLLIIGSGLLAGLMSGLLGVGGGIVMVPLLVMFASLSQHQAHATSLAAVVVIGLVGGATFASDGEVDVAVAALLALGSIVGAPLGARVMAGLSAPRLQGAFGVLMMIVAALLFWN